MSVQLRPSGAGTDRPVLALAVAAVVVTAVGAIWLAQAPRGARPPSRTGRLARRAGRPPRAAAGAAPGGRLGLGQAGPRTTTTFHEVVDLGGTWTFVFSYGGQEVARQRVGGQELAGRGWVVQIPETVAAELERQGYQ